VAPALLFSSRSGQQALVPDVMQGVAPGCVITGEPPILGTFGRDAAFGLPGLTAPGMAGWVTEGAVPLPDRPEPEPVVPEGAGVDGAMPGAGAPPGWVGALPVPVGELAVWAAAAPAARPIQAATATNFVNGFMNGAIGSLSG
jgi:hypothetical protein